MPVITLGSGKKVHVAKEYGAQETYRAAELADVPAAMSRADQIILNIASVAVVVEGLEELAAPGNDDPKKGEVVEPSYGKLKTFEDLVGGSPEGKAMMLKFRSHFTDGEWEQLRDACDEVYRSPKLLKPFRVQL
jgi:hypothetical protein